MASTDKLFAGFKRFKTQYFGEDNSLYASMKEGQPAKTLMIACCDSRVDPAILTDCDPGDLFTVRNVANLVPPSEQTGKYHGTSSAIEYAVNVLNVENIIVMGHANCGGIRALWQFQERDESEFIQQWVSIAQAAKEWVISNMSSVSETGKVKACEQRAILVSVNNLLSFNFIQEKVEQGKLSLHAWYFDISVGELLSYNPHSDTFEKTAE